MPRFSYNIIDADGKQTSGEMDGANVEEVTARLQADGATIKFVRPIVDTPADDTSAENSDVTGRTVRRLSLRDFHRLSGQMGDITEAGLPLVQGLSALAAELPASRFRRGLRSIISRLEAGGDLESVLRDHGAPEDLQALIAAGANSGEIGELLGRYASQARQVSDIKLRVIMALAHPLIILVLLSVLLVSILVGIVPSFSKIFEDFGTTIPGMTKLVIFVSDMLVNHGLWLLAGLVLALCTIGILVAFAVDKMTRRRLICAIPLVGRLLRYSALARFSHLLAILVENGVQLPEALVISGDGAGDAEIQAAGWMMAADVKAGEPLSRSANNMPGIPATLVEAMTWHTQPEVFSTTLRALSEMFESRAHAQTGLITVLWQPFIIVTTGVSVGFTVLALFLPLIKLLNDLS